MKMDKTAFESSTLPPNNMIMHCPHCGENHTWDKEDAYLVDSAWVCRPETIRQTKKYKKINFAGGDTNQTLNGFSGDQIPAGIFNQICFNL